jgi:hypothetical protein
MKRSKTGDGGYFLPESGLTEREMAYCRCVLHVGARNAPECNGKKAWFQTVGGRSCYNPFAVCTASVGTQSECSDRYDFENIPDDELIAYALVRNIAVPAPYDRDALLTTVAMYLCHARGKVHHPVCKRLPRPQVSG